MAPSPPNSGPIDYLAIGHISLDLTPSGPELGGGVSYSGLTAHALGCRVAIVTAASNEADLTPLDPLQVHRLPSAVSTTFENTYTPAGRQQRLLDRAEPLSTEAVPPAWRTARLVHLAPVADELPLPPPLSWVEGLLCCTPQGWLRAWDEGGLVRALDWRRLLGPLSRMDAVVLGWEDIDGQEQAAQALAGVVPILAVTAGAAGVDLFFEGGRHHVPAPESVAVDPTGAGDIFAAAFFVGLLRGLAPRLAARRAVRLASVSVTRSGMRAIPAAEELVALEGELP